MKKILIVGGGGIGERHLRCFLATGKVQAYLCEPRPERARELTLATHELVGCRGMSRVDMIVASDEVYVLELQPIPGLTDTSLVPRAAEAAGISFPQLVDRLIELALEERGGGVSGRES